MSMNIHDAPPAVVSNAIPIFGLNDFIDKVPLGKCYPTIQLNLPNHAFRLAVILIDVYGEDLVISKTQNIFLKFLKKCVNICADLGLEKSESFFQRKYAENVINICEYNKARGVITHPQPKANGITDSQQKETRFQSEDSLSKSGDQSIHSNTISHDLYLSNNILHDLYRLPRSFQDGISKSLPSALLGKSLITDLTLWDVMVKLTELGNNDKLNGLDADLLEGIINNEIKLQEAFDLAEERLADIFVNVKASLQKDYESHKKDLGNASQVIKNNNVILNHKLPDQEIDNWLRSEQLTPSEKDLLSFLDSVQPAAKPPIGRNDMLAEDVSKVKQSSLGASIEERLKLLRTMS